MVGGAAQYKKSITFYVYWLFSLYWHFSTVLSISQKIKLGLDQGIGVRGAKLKLEINYIQLKLNQKFLRGSLLALSMKTKKDPFENFDSGFAFISNFAPLAEP